MTARSLRWRLLVASAISISLALGIVGALLVALFREHVEDELAQRAQRELDALVAGLVVAPAVDDGAPSALTMVTTSTEPAFEQPFGGMYWLVDAGGADLLRSRSWWDAKPPVDLAAKWPTAPSATFTRLTSVGPRDVPLVLWARRVELADSRSVVVAVGGDASRLHALTRSYARKVAMALGVLAVALWIAAWLQVHLGLAPLQRMGEALRQLRAGVVRRLDGHYPGEVQPLVDDLNGVLAENARLVDQARAQTGDLAHALKTPLAVIANAATHWSHNDRELVSSQLDVLRRQVDWHLARARATAAGAAAHQATATATPVASIVEELLGALAVLYRERELRIEPACIDLDLAVALDVHPMQELVGNALDNACKWARSRVQVSARREGDAVVVEVDDDGPGVAPERRDEVLQRGRRLDERTPGSGLGLAIVDELVRLAGGSLALSHAPLGGLRVTLRLPATAEKRQPT